MKALQHALCVEGEVTLEIAGVTELNLSVVWLMLLMFAAVQ